MIIYLLVALLCFTVVMLAWGWSVTEGSTVWEHLSAAFMHSLTIFWAHFMIVIGAGSGLLEQVAPVVGTMDFQEIVRGAIKAEHWPYWLAGIGIITLLARLRSIGDDR